MARKKQTPPAATDADHSDQDTAPAASDSSAWEALAADPVDSPAATPQTPRVAVAGIGASAGGLEAFSQLLRAFPEPPDMALVFVQHLAPQATSTLPALLAINTQMPVAQAEDGVSLEANHVYVIAPGREMIVHEGKLRLQPIADERPAQGVIDLFFRSLARECQSRAIAVVLSGTGSDGTDGIRDVKAAGGSPCPRRHTPPSTTACPARRRPPAWWT